MSQHWAKQQERGSECALQLTRIIVKYAPLFIIKIVVFLVSFYFYITGKEARQAIKQYHLYLTQYNKNVRLPKFAVLNQFLAFGSSIIDRFMVWQHKIKYKDLILDDPDNIYDQMNSSKKGQILMGSHFGNLEICRALISNGHHANLKLNVLVHHKNAIHFNKALEKAGANHIALIEVQDLNVQTMLKLQKKIENGEWLAIAADRSPLKGNKQITIDFLGHQANFPVGAWLLSCLLKTQINIVFCIKEKNHYLLRLRKFSDPVQEQGKKRMLKIQEFVKSYAKSLEDECAKRPLQWFNFYNFWKGN